LLFFDGESCDNLITALAVLMPGGCNSRKISYHFGLRRAQQLDKGPGLWYDVSKPFGGGMPLGGVL